MGRASTAKRDKLYRRTETYCPTCEGMRTTVPQDNVTILGPINPPGKPPFGQVHDQELCSSCSTPIAWRHYFLPSDDEMTPAHEPDSHTHIPYDA